MSVHEGKTEKPKPLFRDITADDDEPETTVIGSLCMNCGENGTTRIFLTKIPHFKDIMLMSFECEHCGYQNNEIQNTGKIAKKGIKIVLNVTNPKDLNRQVVKSDFTSVQIPSLEFEIPAKSQKGEVTTVEGIIDRSINALEQDQVERREKSPEIASKIDDVLANLRALKILDKPFQMVFRDISGNCHVENPYLPLKDNFCTITYFKRTTEENHELGIYEENEDVYLKPSEDGSFTYENLEQEVLTFNTNCPECNSPCDTNMKMTKIPYFKEIVLMSTVCEVCGLKTNEVKSGTGIEPLGVRIKVKVTGKDDFDRDLLKSETCTMEIPELELEVGPTTLAGRFTTVEGIILAVKDQLTKSTAFTGDSSDPEVKKRMDNFIQELNKVLEGKKEVTVILDDPAGNSYIQSLSDDGPDDKLSIKKYERSYEQNDILGLNDMKVDNY